MREEPDRRSSVAFKYRRIRRQAHTSKKIGALGLERLKKDRIFDTRFHGAAAVEDAISGLRRLESDDDSLIVAVDGACLGNGTSTARAGYGIFFSSSLPTLNISGIIPSFLPQTSQYAELYAAIRALEVVDALISSGGLIFSHVIIRTDSAYLSKGMTQWVWKWTVNGYRNVKGQPVVNGEAFSVLHEAVTRLERERRVRISFCKVGREYNQQADRLAKAGII